MLSEDYFSLETNRRHHLLGQSGLDGRLLHFVLEYSPLLRTRLLGRGAIGSTPDFESVDLGSNPGIPAFISTERNVELMFIIDWEDCPFF